MNWISQQFIAIGRAILGELRRLNLGVQEAILEVRDAIKHQKESRRKDKWWNLWDRFVAFATLLAVIAYAYIAHRQWKEMIRAADAAKGGAQVAQETLIASNRPWIDLDISLASPLTFDDGGAHVSFRIAKSNIGHSPAIRVFSDEEFMQTAPNPWKELKRICDQATGHSALPANQGMTQTIFPGKPIEEEWQFTLPKTKMRHETIGPNPLDRFILPKLIICVGYRADFDKTQRHTGYVWGLARFDPSRPAIMLGIEPAKGNIPMGELRLFKEPFIGPLAD